MAIASIPNITSVSITPNPVSANTSFLIAIAVIEFEYTIDPIVYYSGCFNCGEEPI